MSDNTLTKIKSTADIIGGSVFFASEQGFDPEYPNNDGLLPDGMYIRLEGSDGSVVYISAYEIDKAISIIGDMTMGKANSADIDAIIALLDKKASAVDLELIKSDINTLASKSLVEDLSTEVNLKADKSTVDELASIVEDINIDPKEIESMKNDIASLEELVETLNDSSSIAALKNQIAYLKSEVNKRLKIDDLSSINSNIERLTAENNEFGGRLENIESNLNKKASTVYVQGQISELNGAITGISSRLDGKADKIDVATKANKSDVESLTAKVASLNSTVNNTLSDIDNDYKELLGTISTKADKAEMSEAIADINKSLDKKAEKADVVNSLNSINNQLDSISESQEEQYDVLTGSMYEMECEMNNNLAEIRSNINIHSKQISTQANQISKLQETDSTIMDKLRNEWVRVMTPEAYKKLAPVGDTYSDGTPNPYAKQPNTIYMLIRYNKPIAVYIGEILIAQAEQKGSAGFAYTFPIIF